MANIADLVAYDGESTPIIHTMRPISTYKEKGATIAEWRESLPDLPDVAQVRASMRTEKLPSGVTRKELRTVVPVMEVAGPANSAGYTAVPKVAFEETNVTVTYSHPRSTQQIKRNCRQIHKNICSNQTTSTVVVTIGPYIDMIEHGVMPS